MHKVYMIFILMVTYSLLLSTSTLISVTSSIYNNTFRLILSFSSMVIQLINWCGCKPNQAISKSSQYIIIASQSGKHLLIWHVSSAEHEGRTCLFREDFLHHSVCRQPRTPPGTMPIVLQQAHSCCGTSAKTCLASAAPGCCNNTKQQ